MTEQQIDRSGLCDHCTKPSTGGAAGGGLPPQHWCDDHAPDDFHLASLADYQPDPAELVREENAALVARLRVLADTIERLDAAEPLPSVHVSLHVQVSSWDTTEAERIRAVVRLNAAFGHQTSRTWVGSTTAFFDGPEGLYGPTAYCSLDSLDTTAVPA